MISTESAFYYGVEVNSSNNVICFREGAGPELIGRLNSGKYTPTTYLNEVIRAMNEVAETLIFIGGFDRASRIASIGGTGTFTLLVASGSTSASTYTLLGFTGADKTGFNIFGTAAVGKSYRPQFRLQSYVSFEDNQKAVSSTVNVSASGKVELVRFGVVKLMECEMPFITDIDQGFGGYIRTDLQGVYNARDFLIYAVTKGPMEFIPDVANPDTFNYCVLESTPESRDGVDFKLKEQWSRNLPGYYSTGLLTFREVTP